MTHDHGGVVLDALLAVALPDGFTNAYRERHHAVIEHTVRDVTITPVGLDVSTFGFGMPGAYAHLRVDDGGGTYTVGVMATHVGYHVRSAGQVVAFTTAQDAISAAIGEIRGELRRQRRGC